MLRNFLILLVKGYRLFLSPWLGSSCRFEPTCSKYAIEALEKYGAARGSALTTYRLIRCNPWCQGGHDPVPEEFLGKRVNQGLFSGLITPQTASNIKSDSGQNEKK